VLKALSSIVCKNRGGAKLISLIGIFSSAERLLIAHDHVAMLQASRKRPEKHRLNAGLNWNARNRERTKTIFPGSQES
jgi:hypothetical protein